MKNLLLTALCITALLSPKCQSVSVPEKKELILKTATNPLLKGDFPDPSVIRVDDAYYMVSTTMYFTPVAPIMKSYDLINWRIISYCTDIFADTAVFRLESENPTRIGDYNRGQWAASLRYFDDRFWVLFTNLTTGGSFFFSTRDPENEPWERWTVNRSFYDASIFRDPTTDRTYIVHGRGPINLTEMNNDLRALKPGQTDTLLVAQGDVAGGENAEGSHMFYVDGYYYLFLITWGTVHMRQVLCYRSDNVTGPYEGKVVLHKGLGTRGGGVAQGGIVDTPDGDWYGLFFQDRDAVGRVPVLVPMRWEDNWPIFGDENGNIPEEFQIKQFQGYEQNLYVSDDFNDTTLPLAWQWNHNPDNANWSLAERPGYLRLRTGRTSKTVFHARNTLTQRTFEPACEGIVAIEPANMKDGDRAGLMALHSYGGFVCIEQENGQKYIAMYIADNESSNRRGQNAAETLSGNRVAFNGDRVYFKLNFRFRVATGNNTETASFAYSLDGENWTSIGTTLNVIYTLEHFTGNRFALFNYATREAGGYVDFDYFHVSWPGGNRNNQGGTTPIVRSRTNVDYAPEGSRRHSRQRYDLRLPDAGEGPFPLLIYIHGGGFFGGDWQLSANNNGLVSGARSRGYAVASVGYLLMGQSSWSGGQRAFPENVEDVLAAIRHLRANAAEYRLDPDRFAVSGFSAGGYMTAIICALSNATSHGYDVISLGNPGVSHAVQAAASTAALTDFALLNTHQNQNTGLTYFLNHDATPEGALLGGNLTDNTENMRKNLTMQNPLTHITAATPPIYMLHGTNDNLVPWQQSEIMVNKINEFVPNKAVFNRVTGRGHEDFPAASNQITTAILEFLDEKLGIQK